MYPNICGQKVIDPGSNNQCLSQKKLHHTYKVDHFFAGITFFPLKYEIGNDNN